MPIPNEEIGQFKPGESGNPNGSITSRSIKRPWMRQTKQTHRETFDQQHYHTPEYRKDRTSFLAENPLCTHCLNEGISTPATVNDHILPIRHGGDRWDWKNRQGLCDRHHAIKSNSERQTT